MKKKMKKMKTVNSKKWRDGGEEKRHVIKNPEGVCSCVYMQMEIYPNMKMKEKEEEEEHLQAKE